MVKQKVKIPEKLAEVSSLEIEQLGKKEQKPREMEDYKWDIDENLKREKEKLEQKIGEKLEESGNSKLKIKV